MVHRGRIAVAGLAVAVLALAVSGSAAAGPAAPVPPGGPGPATGPAATGAPQRVCDLPVPGRMSCLAVLVGVFSGKLVTPHASTVVADTDTPAVLHPYTAADLQAAYRLPSALLGARQTIAIVDAYDDPRATQDLATYRATNGLPACAADFPCFRKVDQRGGTRYPRTDFSWSLEESLDLDMASAACPNCEILLVEADDNSIPNLGAAVDEAVRLGADVISNSYGAPEFPGTLDELGSHYHHPGVVLVAGSGDSGFGVSLPAALSTVVAAGGTTLYHDGSARSWGERAWAGAGSGCSAYVSKPRWQHDRLCGKRSTTDVAAVADPNTPVAVYDSYGRGGWVAVGGTSVASPLIAGVYALAGNAATVDAGAYLYGHAAALNDVRAGANGYCRGYLCTAGDGYDGPTGWGTPDGIGAF